MSDCPFTIKTMKFVKVMNKKRVSNTEIE